ncbi:MAG: hypothetical protein RIT30_772 [Bacteroidota bacterium]|jgi:hypothetical protein
MKKFGFVLVAFTLIIASCSKGGGSTPVTPTPPPVVVAEPDIAFKVEVDNKEVDYTTYTAALSAAQAVNVNVTTAPFPKDGVTIDVTVKKDVDNSSVFSDAKVGTVAGTNPVTINNLLPGVPCTATVLVTSKTLDPVSKTYKSLSKTFKIARK